MRTRVFVVLDFLISTYVFAACRDTNFQFIGVLRQRLVGIQLVVHRGYQSITLFVNNLKNKSLAA